MRRGVCMAALVATLATGVRAGEPGEAVDGLRLVLNLDATEQPESAPFTGRLRAENRGEAPFALDLRGGARVKLIGPGGQEETPRLDRPAPPPEPGAPRFATLPPGAGRPVAVFTRSLKPDLALYGTVGGRRLGWDLDAGRYRLSIVYEKRPGEARVQEMTNPWTGRVESNVVTLTVQARPVDATPVDGLVLILDTVRTPTGRGGGEQISGRARVKNVSEAPVLVDLGAETALAVREIDGTPVEGTVRPQALESSESRARDFVRLAPGRSATAARFFFLGGALMVEGPVTQTWDLAPGRHKVRATYRSAADRSDVYDREGEAWTGTLTSNDITILSPRP